MSDSFDKIDNDELRAAIGRFSVFLRNDYTKNGDEYSLKQPDAWVPDAPGKNVVRILHTGRGGSGGSSYCFIVLRDFEKGGKLWRKGDILMAAGYKAPAWNAARGNVIDDNYGNATWAGPGYLR
jgi:hypothetical protein